MCQQGTVKAKNPKTSSSGIARCGGVQTGCSVSVIASVDSSREEVWQIRGRWSRSRANYRARHLGAKCQRTLGRHRRAYDGKRDSEGGVYIADAHAGLFSWDSSALEGVFWFEKAYLLMLMCRVWTCNIFVVYIFLSGLRGTTSPEWLWCDQRCPEGSLYFADANAGLLPRDLSEGVFCLKTT